MGSGVESQLQTYFRAFYNLETTPGDIVLFVTIICYFVLEITQKSLIIP